MKKLLYVVFPLLAFMLSACGNGKENEAKEESRPEREMQIGVVSIEDPSDMIAEYVLPDPGDERVSKMLVIQTGCKPNKLVVNCNNFEFTSIEEVNTHGRDPKELGVKATISSPHTITLTFAELPVADGFGALDLKVSGKNDRGDSHTTFLISRYFSERNF